MKYIVDKVKSYKFERLNSLKVYRNKGLFKVCAWNAANLPIKRDPQQQQHKKQRTKTKPNTRRPEDLEPAHQKKAHFKRLKTLKDTFYRMECLSGLKSFNFKLLLTKNVIKLTNNVIKYLEFANRKSAAKTPTKQTNNTRQQQ